MDCLNLHCFACIARSCSVFRAYSNEVSAHPMISSEQADAMSLSLGRHHIANGESDWPGHDLVLDTSWHTLIMPAPPTRGLVHETNVSYILCPEC